MKSINIILILISFSFTFCSAEKDSILYYGDYKVDQIITSKGDVIRVWIDNDNSTTLQLIKSDSSAMFFCIDSLDNFSLFNRTDSMHKTLSAIDLNNNIPSIKLFTSAFLDKEKYREGDSAVLTIRAINRIYPRMAAKVYFPFDSSVYEKRSYPEIFASIDFRNADSIDYFTLRYKFEVQKSKKNTVVFRLFCYEPKYFTCLKFQGTVAELPIKIE